MYIKINYHVKTPNFYTLYILSKNDTPLSEQYIDAIDIAERREGEKAIKKIKGVQDWQWYGVEARREQERILYGYESRFRRVQTGIQAKRSILKQQAVAAKQEGKHAEAGIKYGASVVVAALGGTFEGLTAPIRPYNFPRGLRSLKETLSDPGKRKAAVEEFKTDAAGSLATVGGAVVGGGISGKAVSRVIKRSGLVEGKLSGEFIQETQTRETAASNWFAGKKTPRGTWSKHKSWGPPGSGGYLQEPQLMQQPLTRTVFVPKVTYPDFSPVTILSGVTSLANPLKAPTSPEDPPLSQEPEPRSIQVQREFTRYKPSVMPVIPRLIPSPQRPESQRKTRSIILTQPLSMPTQARSRSKQVSEQVQRQSPLTAPPSVISRQALTTRNMLSLDPPRKKRRGKKKKKGKKRGLAERRRDPVKSLKGVLKI